MLNLAAADSEVTWRGLPAGPTSNAAGQAVGPAGPGGKCLPKDKVTTARKVQATVFKNFVLLPVKVKALGTLLRKSTVTRPARSLHSKHRNARALSTNTNAAFTHHTFPRGVPRMHARSGRPRTPRAASVREGEETPFASCCATAAAALLHKHQQLAYCSFSAIN